MKRRHLIFIPIILVSIFCKAQNFTYMDSVKNLKIVIISKTRKTENGKDTLYSHVLSKYFGRKITQVSYIHERNNVDKYCKDADIIFYVDGEEGSSRITNENLDIIKNEYIKNNKGASEYKQPLGFDLYANCGSSTTILNTSFINKNCLILYINNSYAAGGNATDYEKAFDAVYENFSLYKTNDNNITFYVINNHINNKSINKSLDVFFKHLIVDKLCFYDIFMKLNKSLEYKELTKDGNMMLITNKDMYGFYNHSCIGDLKKNNINNILQNKILNR